LEKLDRIAPVLPLTQRFSFGAPFAPNVSRLDGPAPQNATARAAS
jgi:hypothetical protein